MSEEKTYLAPASRLLGVRLSLCFFLWAYTVDTALQLLLPSALARAVVVGTLGTIFGIESEEEDSAPFANQITASGLSVASGAALVVFFTIALQCVSNLALLLREAKSARFAAIMTAGYLVLAWVVAFGIYLLPLLLS
ncbi:MAG: hypothetical protein VXX89_03810 [Pseudomonadota bacterium]|nr:hypothetical protein [Pseudomonadota bacterium]